MVPFIYIKEAVFVYKWSLFEPLHTNVYLSWEHSEFITERGDRDKLRGAVQNKPQTRKISNPGYNDANQKKSVKNHMVQWGGVIYNGGKPKKQQKSGGKLEKRKQILRKTGKEKWWIPENRKKATESWKTIIYSKESRKRTPYNPPLQWTLLKAFSKVTTLN